MCGFFSEVMLELFHCVGIKANTKVITGKAFSSEEILSQNPDVVIIAIGSKSYIPNITGIDQPFVYDVRAVYENPPTPPFTKGGQGGFGTDIVILGGGDIGCETADHLSSQSKNVTIVEMCDEPLRRMKEIPKEELLKRLKEKGVTILTNTRVIGIEKEKVIIESKDGAKKELKADSVIIAIGSIPENALFDSLRGKVKEIFLVGDSQEPGNLGSALRSATEVGLKI
jgi:pyruvate/2-oxoglutarate dehydrogenase complex dihydrolipoamide dehydrogenase (E3) component